MVCLTLNWSGSCGPYFIYEVSGIPRNRERLVKTGKDEEIWDELQRQLYENNMKVKEGVMQDAFKNPRFLIARKFYEFSTATFITSDPGHVRADKPRGPKNPGKQGRNLG